MRTHWRWVAAAMAALLLVAMTSPADARHHRRHVRAHPAHVVRPAHARLEPPPPGAFPIAQAPGRADTGSAAPSATVVDTHDVRAILGKGVRSSAGEDMGRLVDVVVDRDGQPRAAIIDFGGFLGVGSRKIAVDWAALNFARDDPKGNIITVELTRDQVKAAPEFKEGSPVVVLGPLGNAQPAPATPPKTGEQKTPGQKAPEQQTTEQKSSEPKVQERTPQEPAAPPKAQEK
jgi:PRC-barrel domain protein